MHSSNTTAQVDTIAKLILRDAGECRSSTHVRRAVLLETGLVADKKDHPLLEEVPILSELCAIVFPDTEPRHPPELLRRAFDYGIPSAWDAVYDDIVSDISIDASSYTEEYLRHMIEACTTMQSTRLFSVCYFASKENWPSTNMDLHPFVSDLMRAMVAFIRAQGDVSRPYKKLCPKIVPYLQTVIERLCPPVDAVYEWILQTPESCILFQHHPDLGHLVMKQGLGQHLFTYAERVRPDERYHVLMFIAKLVQNGMPVVHPLGSQTLMALSGTRFDIKVAAAAAVIAREESDPTIEHLARLIETLAATIITLNDNVCHVES